MTAKFPDTDRTTIGRLPERGTRSRDEAYAILDEGKICHVGLTTEHGPLVIPTTYARVGDDLLIHGSPAATWLRATGKGTPICVTVTHVDGLVLARSTFHHSMNYRSVVVFGTAVPITEPAAKAAALDAFVEHLVPGRVAEVRPMHAADIASTLIVALPLAEASVKVRTGGPKDEDEDYALTDVWAGVVPMTTTYGEPVTDELQRFAVPTPVSVRKLQR